MGGILLLKCLVLHGADCLVLRALALLLHLDFL